jgi:hypothetical protein
MQKRKRREYRQMRKQQFKRPEPNFSMYEGRTRGKRIKYTYSDEEDEGYSDTTSRRSTRNTGTHTPAEPAGPTVTLSGRQVRSRQGGAYGESMLSGTHTPAITLGGNDGTSEEHDEDGEVVGRRPRRAAAVQGQNGYKSGGGQHIEGYNSVDEMDDEDDASEQDYGDDEEDDHVSIESDVEDSDDLSNDDDEMEDDLDESQKKSLVVKLPVKTPTPEKKVALSKSSASEGKSGELPRSTSTLDPISNVAVKIGKPATESRVPQVTPDPSTQGASNESSGAEISKPINMPAQPDVNRMLPSPLSPSLAYRGSPEKPPYRFVAPINISQGGL